MLTGKNNKTGMDVLKLFATAISLLFSIAMLRFLMDQLGYTKDIQEVIRQIIIWIATVVYLSFYGLKKHKIQYKICFWIGAICIIILYWLLLIKLKPLGIDLIMLSTPKKVVHALIGVITISRICEWVLARYTRAHNKNSQKDINLWHRP